VVTLRTRRLGATALRSVDPPDERRSRLQFRTLHGYRRAYRIAGRGPVVLLLHGIGDSSRTWLELTCSACWTSTASR
jgi:hypothetical protein